MLAIPPIPEGVLRIRDKGSTYVRIEDLTNAEAKQIAARWSQAFLTEHRARKAIDFAFREGYTYSVPDELRVGDYEPPQQSIGVDMSEICS